MPKAPDLSISKRLTWINMLVSGAALLMACLAFIGYDFATFKETAVHNLSIQAEIIASNTVSAILFNDPQSAEHTLSALKDNPDIVLAVVYEPGGHPFASYARSSGENIFPQPPIPEHAREAHWITGNEITLVRSIEFEGSTSGAVYIRSNIGELDRRLVSYAEIATIVILISLLAAFLVSAIFQRAVVKPIVQLAEIAGIVSRDKNYSVRVAPIRGYGELSIMMDAFNEMLTQIEQRECALEKVHSELEHRVEDRTAELIAANKKVEEASEVVQILNGNLSATNSTLQELNAQLEQRIAERTANLEQTNRLLQEEMKEREKTERELRQVQRLDAVGRLAGGVAHDFNNLLGVILGQSEILLDQVDDEASTQRLNMIGESVQRGAALTRQLLAFGKQQVLSVRVINFNNVLIDIEKLLRLGIGESIELVFEMEHKLGLIKADPGQIEQVILNLAINARDAMPAGGKLTITTANLHLDEAYADRSVIVEPGSYIQVVVSDTGCGMDEQTQSRIFEPFFTTKEQGKGTGLGLATAYGIVKQSGGYIWVYSELGHGTAFKIYLPTVEATVESPRQVERRGELLRGSETILMVEDDTALRKVTFDFLQRIGYTVLSTGSPEEALQLAELHNGPIDFLLTDMIMPRMNGCQLAARLSQTRPEMKTLCVSGYADGIMRDGLQEAVAGGIAFLPKPYTFHALTRKIREVLAPRGLTPDEPTL